MAEFLGQTFVPPDSFNWRRVTKMARAAQGGGDTAEMTSLAAMDSVVDACLRKEDVDRFDELCDEHGVSPDDLMKFVADTIVEVSERPTSRPSDSSGGPTATEPSSTVISSSPVMDRLASRPDLMVIVEDAQSARRTG